VHWSNPLIAKQLQSQHFGGLVTAPSGETLSRDRWTGSCRTTAASLPDAGPGSESRILLEISNQDAHHQARLIQVTTRPSGHHASKGITMAHFSFTVGKAPRFIPTIKCIPYAFEGRPKVVVGKPKAVAGIRAAMPKSRKRAK
jgi:hypothetical protein